ncbi:MAG: hypothetical protein BJ554DRAFT_1385 [Olpidium bornovanus]|uniref:TPR-like protein n=1 Tax=Olpidium bornovanus TaxID=278681 RepID=A0A8H8DHG7_9FUNG|nr:MAG: hypothetical protein BJ554DRAFT_1385 [Olpidium bornovanus]
MQPDLADAYCNLANAYVVRTLPPAGNPKHHNLILPRPPFCARQRLSPRLPSNLKDTKQALDHISTAARLSPTDPEIQFNYGLILDRAGRLEEAVKQYNVAKALGVAKAEALARNAGARLLAVKQPDDAVGKGGATTTDNEGSTK